MSTSILKKSLELFSDDLVKLGNSGAGKGKKQRFKKGAGKKKLLKLVDIKKEQRVDFTNKNVKFLTKLSRSRSATPAIEKVVEFQKSQERRKPKKPKKEKSAFTEDDFEKFEREYFVKS